LIEAYGCNPYRIIEAGYVGFCARMRKAAPRIQKQTLQRLWEDAQSSVLNEQPEAYMATLEMHLRQLINDYLEQIRRKEGVVQKMIEVLNRLRGKDPKIPPSTPGVINDKTMARLLGETGPLSDFGNGRMLMRYGGLNIRMRAKRQVSGAE